MFFLRIFWHVTVCATGLVRTILWCIGDHFADELHALVSVYARSNGYDIDLYNRTTLGRGLAWLGDGSCTGTHYPLNFLQVIVRFLEQAAIG